jgi:hypothetical protein
MKYFEVYDPYYALAKAHDKEEARKAYVKFVADDDGTLINEIEEVEHDYALLKFSRAKGKDGKLSDISEVLKEFKEHGAFPLLMDGALA